MDKKPLFDSDIDPKRIKNVADGLRRQREFESARMLDGYADLLEAQEKAVPVAFRYLSQQSSTLAWVWSGWLDLGDRGISALHVHCKTSGDTKIEYAYAHPNSSDAERLAEALRVIRQHVAKDPSALADCIIATCDSALAAHSAQAQPPAASVTDAMVNAAMRADFCGHNVADALMCGTDWNTEVMRAALEAALAAQENPNG